MRIRRCDGRNIFIMFRSLHVDNTRGISVTKHRNEWKWAEKGPAAGTVLRQHRPTSSKWAQFTLQPRSNFTCSLMEPIRRTRCGINGTMWLLFFFFYPKLLLGNMEAKASAFESLWGERKKTHSDKLLRPTKSK